METVYKKEDLHFDHYVFTVDRRDMLQAKDLNEDLLDIEEGYELLLFVNTFLDLYVPDHTINDLHAVEYIFANNLPPYLRVKKDIAIWLAKNLHYLDFAKHANVFYKS
jgi:hypothetical protein